MASQRQSWTAIGTFSLLLTLLLCPLCLSQDCDEDTLQCYNCDSLTFLGCDDPFNSSDPFIPQISCKTFCVKYSKISPKGSHIVTRTCKDDMEINLHIPDEVCRSNIKQGGHICFCNSDNCNAAPTTALGHIPSMYFLRHSTTFSYFPVSKLSFFNLPRSSVSVMDMVSWLLTSPWQVPLVLLFLTLIKGYLDCR